MKPLRPGPQLGVAVSGGGDSVALMLLVSLWRDWLGQKDQPVPDVTVLTVDHGLRREAAQEARQVGRWARALGFSHKTLKWVPAEKPSANIQQAARDARYSLLTGWAGAREADLLVAHHLDDQAETFLIRLQRGSGVDGLAAMTPVSVKAGVRVLRPLLTVPQARLRATLRVHQQKWVEDPSNEDARFLRVQVRKALPLLDELGLTRDRLVETALRMTRARAALDDMCDQVERAAVCWCEEGFARVALRPLREVPDEIALRLLARILKGVTGSVYAPRLQGLEALLMAVRTGSLQGGRTLGGAKWSAAGKWPGVNSGDEMVVLREGAGLPAEPLTLKPGGQAVWDGRFRVMRPKKLVAGEVRALGADGLKLAVSLARENPQAYGCDLPHQVPRPVLHALPAYWREGGLLAQPHLGFFAPECGGVFEARFIGGRPRGDG